MASASQSVAVRPVSRVSRILAEAAWWIATFTSSFRWLWQELWWPVSAGRSTAF